MSYGENAELDNAGEEIFWGAKLEHVRQQDIRGRKISKTR